MENFYTQFIQSKLAKENLDNYSKAFRAACSSNPPPYAKAWYGQLFRELACNPEWFANLLVANAHMEGYSSKQIWDYSQSIADAELANNIRLHALDEARHSKIFPKMLNLTFPEALDEELSFKLKQLSPDLMQWHSSGVASVSNTPLMTEQQVLNTLIQINIFETQALLLQYLLRPPLLAHSSSDVHSRLLRFCSSLIADEIKHIKYTALYIERAMLRGHEEYIYSAMIDFQAMFNQMTLENVEQENLGL